MFLEPPPHPPPRQNQSTSCNHHPQPNVTGFCSTCLRDRLSLLEEADPESTVSDDIPVISSDVPPHILNPPPHWSYLHESTISGGTAAGDIPVNFQSHLPHESTVYGSTAAIRRAVNFEFSEAREEEEAGEERMEMEKDYAFMDSQTRNPTTDKAAMSSSAVAGGFRAAASVFGKKLQKWRRKKKVGGDGHSLAEVAEERDEKQWNWETTEYGSGRYSVEAEPPRMSLDASRMPWDKPRHSMDNPRSSCDGHSIGGRQLHRIQFMDSVVEDGPIVIRRMDNKIPVDMPMNLIHNDPEIPGGSVQTRDYYWDSSSQRRRRSFERSRSGRSPAAPITDETHSGVLNSKVSPSIPDDIPRTKIADSRVPNLNSKSLREDRSEFFEPIYHDIPASRSTSKKSGWWKFWRRGGGSSKDEYNDYASERYDRGNVIERCMSETWRNEELKGPFNPKLLRSNSVASSRSMRYGVETSGNGKKRREGILLERNQSARYSSSAIDSRQRSNWGSDLRSTSKKPDSSAGRPPWLF